MHSRNSNEGIHAEVKSGKLKVISFFDCLLSTYNLRLITSLSEVFNDFVFSEDHHPNDTWIVEL